MRCLQGFHSFLIFVNHIPRNTSASYIQEALL